MKKEEHIYRGEEDKAPNLHPDQTDRQADKSIDR